MSVRKHSGEVPWLFDDNLGFLIANKPKCPFGNTQGRYLGYLTITLGFCHNN